MNLAVKNFFLITFKNAINAVLTSGVLMVIDSGNFNMHDKAGWWNLGKAVVSVVVGREAAVWGPILLKWSSTSSNPAAVEIPTNPPGGRAGVYVPPEPPQVKP
jgi:hypothetical protein